MMKIRIFIFLILAFFIDSCKKDIIVPKENFNKLFGTWELLYSTGGIAGDTINYANEDNIRILYKKNGIFKKYKNYKRINKMTFKFEEDATSSSKGKYIISYSEGKFSKKMPVSHWFEFLGNDTLILTDICADCYTSTYVRE